MGGSRSISGLDSSNLYQSRKKVNVIKEPSQAGLGLTFILASSVGISGWCFENWRMGLGYFFSVIAIACLWHVFIAFINARD